MGVHVLEPFRQHSYILSMSGSSLAIRNPLMPVIVHPHPSSLLIGSQVKGHRRTPATGIQFCFTLKPSGLGQIVSVSPLPPTVVNLDLRRLGTSPSARARAYRRAHSPWSDGVRRRVERSDIV